MVRLLFVEPSGRRHSIEAGVGRTLKDIALDNGVSGIPAECGGACACATCHVYIDDSWIECVGRAEGLEQVMLELALDVRETSRLSCQIVLAEKHDGLIVTVPQRQA